MSFHMFILREGRHSVQKSGSHHHRQNQRAPNNVRVRMFQCTLGSDHEPVVRQIYLRRQFWRRFALVRWIYPDNATDLVRIPSEAALLAMDGSALGVGSDVGGSLRIPTSYCGVYSLKPSSDRVSGDGTKGMVGGSFLRLQSVLTPGFA